MEKEEQNFSINYLENSYETLCHKRHIINENLKKSSIFNKNINNNNKLNKNKILNNNNNNIYNNNSNLIIINNNLCNLCLCQICSCSNNNSCFYSLYLNKNSNNNNKNLNTNESTTGFLKFLARFSGRRRSLVQILKAPKFIFILIVLSLFNGTEACSARTTPKPRPPPTPTPRPNITFHTYKCPSTYAEWYCLNDATCFSVKIGDEILYNCWCAEGYMGPRCEFKEIDGSFLPTRPRIMMETASIASGATLALILVVILCLLYAYTKQQRQKKLRLAEEEELGRTNSITNGTNNGIDTVDGTTTIYKCEHHVNNQPRRPFGPHHYKTIPLSDTLKR